MIVVELFDLIVGAVEFVRFVFENVFQGFHLRLILLSRLQLDQRQLALVLALLVGKAALQFGSGRFATGQIVLQLFQLLFLFAFAARQFLQRRVFFVLGDAAQGLGPALSLLSVPSQ